MAYISVVHESLKSPEVANLRAQQIANLCYKSATELLTGAEIDAFKASLEMQIQFNKDIIPKSFPCAIVILDTEVG